VSVRECIQQCACLQLAYAGQPSLPYPSLSSYAGADLVRAIVRVVNHAPPGSLVMSDIAYLMSAPYTTALNSLVNSSQAFSAFTIDAQVYAVGPHAHCAHTHVCIGLCRRDQQTAGELVRSALGDCDKGE
jgi:hypothetical protein